MGSFVRLREPNSGFQCVIAWPPRIDGTCLIVDGVDENGEPVLKEVIDGEELATRQARGNVG
jgi:hypothetical protein